jgi:hypothetical protein
MSRRDRTRNIKMTATLNSTATMAAILLAASATTSQATPINVLDSYWGGKPPAGYGDVVANAGDHRFDISSMLVERVANSLNVVINTNYSGANIGALGTNVGALFIGDPTKLNYNGGGTAANHYLGDRFTNDTDRFGYAFDFDVDPKKNFAGAQNGAGSLFSLKGNGSDVVLSNANGGFRQYEAVDINKKAKDTGVNGTWSVGVGSITFNISDFFKIKGLSAIYQTSLTLAWAMTCSNDIILATVTLPNNNTPEVPLPAGAALLLSGLAGLGFLGRSKNKAKNT